MVALTLAPAISIPTLYFSRFSVAISPLSSASVAEPGLMSRILSLKYEARRASSGQAVSGSSSRRKKAPYLLKLVEPFWIAPRKLVSLTREVLS